MISSTEGIYFAKEFDLNMGYYYNKLDTDFQRLSTLVSPCGKYKRKRLPTDVKIFLADDVFVLCKLV
jgi:hypothetical protein